MNPVKEARPSVAEQCTILSVVGVQGAFQMMNKRIYHKTHHCDATMWGIAREVDLSRLNPFNTHSSIGHRML
jgi:hypothetical protein